jgi:lactate dehydrogenase-like 2-hydroxyacid dehydrogenase
MKKILVTRNLLVENEKRILDLFNATLNKEDKVLSSDDVISLSKDCDGILCIGGNKFDKEIIDKLSPGVKIIANYAVGYNNVDVDAASARGIIVTNTPEVLTDATADISILLLLGASRRAYEGRKNAESQNWVWSANLLLGKQMSNHKLGILGMGRIGRAVAKRARGFGMEIHYHNRSRLTPDLEQGAIFHSDVKSFFSHCDFLSINCPATPETFELLNEETIKFLPDKAVVANAARGDVINDVAMIKALKSGKVFALGLDVYNGEPKINDEYLKLDNLFLLPHLGSATKRTRIDMGDRAIDNLQAFFSNHKAKDQVN